MTIWFDMDGTIADLYGVPYWEEMLDSSIVDPYMIAKPMEDLIELSEFCNQLQSCGVRVGVLSWNSRSGDESYHRAVRKAKRNWLKEYFPLAFDEIHIIKYGTSKTNYAKSGDILIDDDYRVRSNWREKCGDAYDPANFTSILAMLKELVERGCL